MTAKVAARAVPAGNLSRRTPVSVFAAGVLAVGAFGFQTLLTSLSPTLNFLNLPFLMVVYAVSATRNAVPAMLMATLVGWAQDGLTHEPVGLFGTVYAILAYMVATASRYFKMTLPLVLGLFVAVAYLLHEFLLFVLRFYFLAQDVPSEPITWPALTALHAGLALLLYPLCDRLARRL